MHLLITGADGSLGAAVTRHLAGEHSLRLTGRAPHAAQTGGKLEYRQVDLRCEEPVKELVAGIDGIVHLAAFDPEPCDGDDAEQQALGYATLGTYVLCHEARRAGVDRVIVVGSLRVFDAYPDSYRIDETWKPRPAPTAVGLAPYLCEQVVREYAREGGINAVCLRFLPIGDEVERNTRLADALQAIDGALGLEFRVPGYRWYVFHIASSRRYVMRDARRHLGFQREGER